MIFRYSNRWKLGDENVVKEVLRDVSSGTRLPKGASRLTCEANKMGGADKEDANLILLCLRSYKYISGRLRWNAKRHQDYAEAKFLVNCPALPEIDGRLILTAHKARVPYKYGFSLMAGSLRIFGLDVNPGMSHYNRRTLTSVSGTHWQVYPHMDAEPDNRELAHREWLLEFCKRIHLESRIEYATPPHTPVQLEFGL